MENELQKIADEKKNQDFQYLKNSMEPLKEILPERAIIKERDFKIYFLPIIDGTVEINEENMERFRHNVLQLTDSYRIGFEVVNDDNNETLFKLPPLIMDIDKDGIAKEVNYSKLGNMYREMSTGSNSAAANSFLSSSFDGLGKILVPSEDEEKFYENEILKIFQKYGIKPSAERDISENKDKVTIDDNKSNSKLDDEEYDDLFDYE